MNDNNHRIQRILAFLDKSPKDCFLLHALALENIKLGNLEEGVNIFQKVLSLDPNYVGSYYHLGKTYEALNKKENALQTYEEGIKMASLKGDFHSLNELRSALNQLMDEDF